MRLGGLWMVLTSLARRFGESFSACKRTQTRATVHSEATTGLGRSRSSRLPYSTVMSSTIESSHAWHQNTSINFRNEATNIKWEQNHTLKTDGRGRMPAFKDLWYDEHRCSAEGVSGS